MAKKKGLWANIHAKRKRGEAPAKKGEKGYPKTLDIAEKGGKLNGKSHLEGGIPIEVEGGEYVIKKDSVNSDTESALDFINENGTLPYEFDGEIPITDARTRNKRRK